MVEVVRAPAAQPVPKIFEVRPFESTKFRFSAAPIGPWSEVIMNEELLAKQADGDAALLELGVVLGQSLAFGLVAGRCSAAQAQALRRLREERLYKRCTEAWLEFCPKYLKISRAE